MSENKSLQEYIFAANYDPISKRDTAEMITVKMPAYSEQEAWDKLEWMVGGMGAVQRWRLNDVIDYK